MALVEITGPEVSPAAFALVTVFLLRKFVYSLAESFHVVTFLGRDDPTERGGSKELEFHVYEMERVYVKRGWAYYS